MEKFIIHGGKALHGSVRLGGAKNASFKLMIACLLVRGETHLLNIPRISDVEVTREMIEHLGGKVHSAGERLLCIDATGVRSTRIPEKFGKASRASTLFLGPLLTRFKEASVPLPGGDRIGTRPLDRHFAGLRALGAEIREQAGRVSVTAKRLRGSTYHFPKNTHTGTELMLLVSVLAEGVTVLTNASEEPEVDDLMTLLTKMGGRIERLAGRTIRVTGVGELHSTIHKVMPDRNEAVSYGCAALATHGDIIVEDAVPGHLTAFLDKINEAGGNYELGDFGIRFFYTRPLQATDVVTAPHPGFMTDWQPLWAVLMTQARGVAIINEAVHANRFQYVRDLQRMGGRIEFFNPPIDDPPRFYNFNPQDDRPEYFHAVRIHGPSLLKATELTIDDLRAGATLVLAALIAKGKSTIWGVEHIDRGYENIDGRLIDLGASIKRV